ncbi:hypothetical protein [Chondrinema litorale]|uniref:hypothetical protein n=1 Tax=Chondrinema litorale TaxID=2994555 RepID=UPI00254353BF|nr:hypothetical protein [Chondrinema litorale]UZR98653.1 hypothetical protein OQ292_33020 [Chondrinema litorale]
MKEKRTTMNRYYFLILVFLLTGCNYFNFCTGITIEELVGRYEQKKKIVGIEYIEIYPDSTYLHYYKNDTVEYTNKEKLTIEKRRHVCYVILRDFAFKTSTNIKNDVTRVIRYHWTGDALSLDNLDYDFYKVED